MLTQTRLTSLLLLLTLPTLVCGKNETSAVPSPTVKATTTVKPTTTVKAKQATTPHAEVATDVFDTSANVTTKNSTDSFYKNDSLLTKLGGPNGSYLRAFYVIVGVGALIVCYLVVKSIIVRRQKRKSRQYGSARNAPMELNAMDDEEEDDLFDASRRRLIS